MILAHPGQPPAPHDLWSAWSPDPLILVLLMVAGWAYRSGRAHRRHPSADRWRGWCFAGALTTLAVALLSPLDVLAGALASAHMVQHLLIMLVAAPLLALSAPAKTVWLGVPPTGRRAVGRWRARSGLTRRNIRMLHNPGTAWLAQAGVLWFWHAAVPYQAALDHDTVHALQHWAFLLAAVMFWRVVVGIARVGRPSPGLGILFVFTTAMHGAILSALLTFAPTPWYSGYAGTTRAWHLTPLADQQLAGVLMWIPGGLVYLGTALTLLVTWIRRSERSATQPAAATSVAPMTTE